ncbi:hypothetical protein V501_00355 [Pseudogymnoascus sp. VKM F-4519 (FW-2642)]|nr:hypothetical protein V501_00355 [Pseudogymnoascus sp. VKM F-4519 (FW-2642)]
MASFIRKFSGGSVDKKDPVSSPSVDSKTNLSGEVIAEEQGEVYITSDDRRNVGRVSAAFLVFNRMIGTGIFATPSSIFAQSGSVGLALFIWVAGMIIAGAGLAVYLEFGTGLPRNGGEKNYLEYVFRKPKFLATAMYASYVVLLGWAGSNSVVFGEYILHAANVEVNRWNQRGVGLACITAAFLIHGFALNWGLRLQNVLGVIKLLILLLIVFSGFAALGGHLQPGVEKPDNFTNAFAGTTGSAYGVVSALYNVIWSYIGYSNANYALAETKNPVRTLKVAAPLALGAVAILYMLANIAYFAAVPREEILSSGRILAASFFRNMFGPEAERALSVFVALSAFGNVLSVIFSQGRLVQEIGREGILPFSHFWASNAPFNTPLVGLAEHWLVSVIIMLAPPPGDAYNFILNVISYPLAVVNVFVAGALVHLYLHPSADHRPTWSPPFRATLPVVIFFLLSNIYLVVAPFVPPDEGQSIYKDIPYYLHCLVGIAILLAGALYWLIWAVILPKLGGYELDREVDVDAHGWSRGKMESAGRIVPSAVAQRSKVENGRGDLLLCPSVPFLAALLALRVLGQLCSSILPGAMKQLPAGLGGIVIIASPLQNAAQLALLSPGPFLSSPFLLVTSAALSSPPGAPDSCRLIAGRPTLIAIAPIYLNAGSPHIFVEWRDIAYSTDTALSADVNLGYIGYFLGDTLPLKSDHWSHKHVTRSKGGGPFGVNACFAIARGMMGARDDDLDEDTEEDEEFDWDEFYASEQEDEE